MFGVSLGVNNTPTSWTNVVTLGKQLGLSALYIANKKYELETGFNFYARRTKVVIEKRDTYIGREITSVRTNYQVFEMPLLVHYKFKENENGSILKVIFGTSFSFNNIKDYDLATEIRSGHERGYSAVAGKGYNGQNMTGNLIIGISKLKQFKKFNKQFYSWTLLYQKAMNRAPNFENEGVKPHSQKPYYINYSPYLDALCLKLTYFPFSTAVK